MTPDTPVVFAAVLVALVFFAIEPVPVDVTAIGVMVSLMLIRPASKVLVSAGTLGAPIVLSESYPGDASSGFANTVTLTALVTFILSEGAQRTGITQLLGAKILTFTGDGELRQLGATVSVVGPISDFINNTAVVAILFPMVTDLVECGQTSPSKLLLPLPHAPMFDGMLMLIGTSINILTSDVYSRITGGAPFSMLESTMLGAVVMAIGVVYLTTIGRRLIPGRIEP